MHPSPCLTSSMIRPNALSHLLPEGAELMGDVGRLPPAIAVIAGYLAFSLIDAALHAQTWERAAASTEDPGSAAERHPSLLGLSQSAGIILHSLLDGVA